MKGTIVVKMGGVAADNLKESFFQQIRSWQAQGKMVVIVHGGGHYISEMMETLHVPVEKKAGLRVTNQATLDITKLVLLGKVQPMITTTFQKAGIPSVGLNAGCDQLICGEVIDKEKFGYVGKVKEVNTELIRALTSKKHVPVIAPLGITEDGQWLNINADDVACKVATSLKAEELFLLTDVPGIKKEKEWLPEVSLDELDELKTEKVVTGGMIPKLESAKNALLHGVGTVHISDTVEHVGTRIIPEAIAV